MTKKRIAVLDSGVNPTHPHVGGLGQGISFVDGGKESDTIDLLGHGTAVASLIHALAPDAEIIPVRVFGQTLATNLSTILRGIEWCAANEIDIVNLSMGTTNESYRGKFVDAIEALRLKGALLVCPYSMGTQLLLPGSLPGVIPVLGDPACAPDQVEIRTEGPLRLYAAQPFPRDIPGIPKEFNLNGVSFAVGRVSAFLASSAATSTGDDAGLSAK